MNSEDEAFAFDKFIEVMDDNDVDFSDKENKNCSVKRLRTKPEQINKITAFVKGIQRYTQVNTK